MIPYCRKRIYGKDSRLEFEGLNLQYIQLICFCRFWLSADFICTFSFCWSDNFPTDAILILFICFFLDSRNNLSKRKCLLLWFLFWKRITLHSSAHIISSLSHDCCCVCTENHKSTLPVFPFLICTQFLTSVLSTFAFQRNQLFFERKAMERSTFISPCRCRNGCDKYDLFRH